MCSCMSAEHAGPTAVLASTRPSDRGEQQQAGGDPLGAERRACGVVGVLDRHRLVP